jgi:serine/threonine-protein kinase HipA
MTSEPTTAFVWIWLPGAEDPVVCGRIDADRTPVTFTYGRQYLDRSDAVPIYEPELPLRIGPQTTASGIGLPLCIDDAMPDSWGRHLVNHRLGKPTTEFSDITYLLQSGSNRIGALDFQSDQKTYVARESTPPSLQQLAESVEAITAGKPVAPALADILINGTLIGGARPKAVLADEGKQLIAKFSRSTDTYLWVQSEFVAMELASRVGIHVAPVEIVRAGDRLGLLVERFDRTAGGHRRRMVSALTILGLNTFPDGRYATYAGLAHQIRAQFVDPDATLRELFSRISFNILCGNTDDHGRNQAAFVDSTGLTLTPAYDIAPQQRAGETAQQAMSYTDDIGNRDSRIELLAAAAGIYHLADREARDIVAQQVHVIRSHWDEVCDVAELTQTQRDSLMDHQFLNPHAFE